MSLNANSLEIYLRAKGKIAVALSGGLDSSALLAASANILGAQNVLTVTAETPYMMREEISYAQELADKLGVEFLRISLSEIPNSISENPPDRCYKCKLDIFEKIKTAANSRGIETIADGTNADDLSDWRPGMRALKELGISSPFLECGLGKKEIREIARSHNLKVANKPAYACLLTRLEHGTRTDAEILKKIDNAEIFLRGMSFKIVRVRLHGECARVEISPDDFENFFKDRAAILAKLKTLGFKHVALDLNGYSQGSMNKK